MSADATPLATDPQTPRDVAERYVTALTELRPDLATALGTRPDEDRMTDYSPEGAEQRNDLARATLVELDAVLAAHGAAATLAPVERRCARLLAERLQAELALADAGEDLRAVGTLFSPVQRIRQVFLMMPTATPADWEVLRARLHAVPGAVQGYRRSLELGLERDLPAGPTQVRAVVEQLDSWLDPTESGAPTWFHDLVAAGPAGAEAGLVAAAEAATVSIGALRDWLREVYAPAVAGAPDVVGRERYARFARQWTGSDLDLDEAYAWGLAEVRRLDVELAAEAERVLPGATVAEAMAHLDQHGDAVEGVEEVRQWLQDMMDRTIEEMDGTHVDLAPRVRRVEAMIAPPGSAAAPYYSRPSLDFSRPGRTWLPTLGETRFPLWGLISTWYHEGVPGHHLQLAQWAHLSEELSRFQGGVGSVSATTEGWALYAEGLADELGYLSLPGARLGYLDAQMMRAVRVVIDIGMHLQLVVPDDLAEQLGVPSGSTWTPELGRALFGGRSGRSAAFADSELVRYLGMPGQAISYKLGERAWREGRAAAEAAQGEAFDLKAWHMGALSLGALGLDDLVQELAALPA